MKQTVKKLTSRAESYVFVIILVLSAVIQLRSGLFYSNNNIVDIVRSMIVPLIYALCAYLAFVSTGPDVSFPLIAALSSYLATEIALKTGYDGPVILVFIIAVFFGLLMGAVNGLIIVKFNFPSLIVTLATSSMYSGILFGVFEASRMDLPENMYNYGKASLLSVKNATTGLGSTLPTTFLIVVGLYIAAYLVLNHTMAGRGVFALGGDEVSAQRAGFNTKLIRFGVFTVNGGLAAIAGVCYTVMSLKYLPAEFAGGEMVVIAAVILGGTRMSGGFGTLTGCVLGTMLLTMVTNSLILVGIPVYFQKVFIGAFIVIGTALSASSGRKRKSAGKGVAANV